MGVVLINACLGYATESRSLVWISSTVCGVVFGIGLLRGYGLIEMMKSSISLAVAAVPEGLPPSPQRRWRWAFTLCDGIMC